MVLGLLFRNLPFFGTKPLLSFYKPQRSYIPSIFYLKNEDCFWSKQMPDGNLEHDTHIWRKPVYYSHVLDLNNILKKITVYTLQVRIYFQVTI